MGTSSISMSKSILTAIDLEVWLSKELLEQAGRTSISALRRGYLDPQKPKLGLALSIGV